MHLDKARARLREIAQRACIDPVYMEQLQNDAVETLVKEGLPYDVIEDFLRETRLQGEVSGYAIPECSSTCALTQLNEVGESLQHSLQDFIR